MTYKNILFCTVLLIFSQWGFSQLKVKPDGHVGIGTSDPFTRLHVYGETLIESHAAPWESAVLTRVYNKNTSAYTLRNAYYGKEVFLVNGEGWLWSRQGAYVGTDSSLIGSKSPIQNPLAAVLQLNGIRFSYRDEPGNGPSVNYRMGLVAQEVNQVAPEATRMMPDSLMAVSYAQLLPLLVEAIKEQQAQISELQGALFAQEEEIGKIKNRRWFRKKTVE